LKIDKISVIFECYLENYRITCYAFHILWCKMEELISKVARLKKLEESFGHSLNKVKEDPCILDQALGHLDEWIRVKKQIRLATLETSVLLIPDSVNKEARTIIQKINLGEKLPFEEIFNGTAFEELFDTELKDDEISCLESDVFYSWFSGYDYVRELYSVGMLIAGVGDLPSNLSMFVDELRLCYVFQRYLAVYALCRAVLEISMRDIYKKNNLDDIESENRIRVKELISRTDPKFRFPNSDPTLYQMIKMLTTLHSYEHLGETLDDIREKTNPIAHGNIYVRGSKPCILKVMIFLLKFKYDDFMISSFVMYFSINIKFKYIWRQWRRRKPWVLSPFRSFFPMLDKSRRRILQG